MRTCSARRSSSATAELPGCRAYSSTRTSIRPGQAGTRNSTRGKPSLLAWRPAEATGKCLAEVGQALEAARVGEFCDGSRRGPGAIQFSEASLQALAQDVLGDGLIAVCENLVQIARAA